MAISLLSDMKVYDDLYNTALTETLQKNLNVFNQASNGAIVLQPRFIQGYNEKVAFYTKIANLVSRRDTTSTADATALKLVQGENVHPKLFKKIGPVEMTEGSWRTIGHSWEEIAYVLGQQTAPDVLDSFIESVMSAFVGQFKAAAIAATNVNSQTTRAISALDINRTLEKLGDKRSRVKIIVMHSKPFADLIEDQTVNYKFDMVSGFTLAAGSPKTANLPVLVVDSPALLAAGSGTSVSTDDTYYTLFLTEMAGGIIQSEAEEMLIERVGGKEQLIYRVQGEYAYNVMVKGASYSAGTVNPTDANLATGTNWTKTATSFKDLAGAALITR